MITYQGVTAFVDPITREVYADDAPCGVFLVGEPDELRWGVKNGGEVLEKTCWKGKTLQRLLMDGVVP